MGVNQERDVVNSRGYNVFHTYTVHKLTNCSNKKKNQFSIKVSKLLFQSTQNRSRLSKVSMAKVSLRSFHAFTRNCSQGELHFL